MQHSTGTLIGADHAGDTAPFPTLVADALSRLLRAFPPPAVAECAARHEAAARTTRELSSATAWMAAGEFDRLADVQDAMAAARTQLIAAGRGDLIGGA